MKPAVAIAVLVTAACGGPPSPPVTLAAPTPVTAGERMVGLLPEGAQVIVEVDLARLRANPVVGDWVMQALPQLDVWGLGAGMAAADSALTASKAAVFAAYGVGTAAAATLTLWATTDDVPGGTRVAPDIVAFGAAEWLGQVATRAAIAADHPLAIAGPWRELRTRAAPKGATGAVVRIAAQLPFDARIAFARMIGIEAPAQLALWADVADDAALVLEADAADPGTRSGRDSGRRLAASLRQGLAAAAELAAVRALGLATSLEQARVVVHGGWVRAVIAIGPRHLARVVERARAMLPPRHEAP